MDTQKLRDLSTWLTVTEVDNAELFISKLFQRKFHSRPPDFRRHFVAFFKPDSDSSHVTPVGYVHQTPYLDCHLCGGLVIDDRIYRLMSVSQRKVIREAGGIAEILLHYSFSKLGHTKAVWGHVGDTKSEKVVLRVGFVHTVAKPIMVCWRENLEQQEKDKLLKKIIALGPF